MTERRGSTIVVQSRVSPATAAKIKTTAVIRGISEAEVIRLWLDAQASRVNETTFAAELEACLEKQKQEKLRTIRELSGTVDRSHVEFANTAR